MSFRRGSGFTAVISILATVAIFGSQQAPAIAAVRAAGVAAAPGAPPTVSAASSYTPITPNFRILDTRSGLCGGTSGGCHALGKGGILTLQVTGYVDPGTSNSVPAGATAVVMNVTEVDDPSFSLLTVYPAGTSPPLASNLNFLAHTAEANLVTTQLSAGGAVSIENALGTVNVLGDVEGYFMAAPAGHASGEYHPIPPLRVCDSRVSAATNVCNTPNNGKDQTIGAGDAVRVKVAGMPLWCTVPTNCPSIPTDGTEEMAIINLTGIAGTVNTFLTVVPYTVNTGCLFGGNKGAPSFSTVNVAAGHAQANRVFVDLAPNSSPLYVCIYNAAGRANFIIDDDGWFGGPTAATGLQFYPTSPTRICDTRSGTSTPCSGHPLTQNSSLTVAAAGQDGIASAATAIIANLTAVAGTSFTYLTLYPADATSPPNASDINVAAGQVQPNLTAVQLSGGGSPGNFKIFNALGTINAVVDVEGWFQ
jgi:hypothetical protein